ncbi:hypothetical protein P12x_002479 [Tundrisphaera lichenicola]|uniref:hypothetical protein n=1 Tax=Tundrisphaera lichenicola TaxID=2029860 RepID=UPI003EB83032
MGETFWCGDDRVKFSNGATELLFRHWLGRAEARPDTPGMTAVAAFLRHRISACGDGGRAFGMNRDRFPAELSAPETVSAMAVLIEESAADATQIGGIDWEPHHQEWWESRLRLLARAIRAWQSTLDR